MALQVTKVGAGAAGSDVAIGAHDVVGLAFYPQPGQA
jgi:hypothetical protein